MSYTMYTPLNVWLDPASVTDVVAYIQTYLSENTIYSEEEIEELIHDYLEAHPELIGGVQSVNGKTGTVVLTASDINTANNVTIEYVLSSLSSQISSIAASVATNTYNITSLTGRVSTAETDISNLKSNIRTTKTASGSVVNVDDAVEGSEVENFSSSGATKVYRGSRNLFDWNSFINNAAIKQRCTLSANSDGSVTITSTASGSMWAGFAASVGSTISANAFKIPVYNGQTIYLSKTSKIVGINLFIIDSSNTVLKVEDLSNNSPFILINNSNAVAVVPRVNFQTASASGETYTARLGLSVDGRVNYKDNFIQTNSYDIVNGVLSTPIDFLPGANVLWSNGETISFDYLVTQTFSDFDSDINDLSGFVGYEPIKLEYGGINIANGVLVPNATESLYSTRCRINPYYPIHLNVGDAICLKNKSTYAYYLYLNSGVIAQWISSNFVVQTAGNYCFSIKRIDNGSIDLNDVERSFCVYRKSWGSAETLPSYYESYISDKLDAIQNNMNFANGAVFTFFTDAHFPSNAMNSRLLITEILDKTSVPFVIYGGDTTAITGDETTLDSSIKTLMEYQNTIGVDNWYAAHGNHDFYCRTDETTPTTYSKTLKECYNIMFRKSERFVTNMDCEHLCYCIDIPAQKTRFVVLNSTDTAVPAGSIVYTTAQLQWLVDVLKELSDTKIIIISHISSDPTLAESESSLVSAVQSILVAFKSKGTTTVDGETVSFAGTTNELICQISGHSHSDGYHVDNGILGITTTCDAAYTDDGEGMVLGTITEQAIDVFFIDYENQQIKTVRVGRGSNRGWNYSTGNVLS